MSPDVSRNLPPQELEKRAAEQRLRIHESVAGLKSSLTDLKSSVEENVRERLDARRLARQHFGKLAAGASVFALIAGYGVAGIFTRH